MGKGDKSAAARRRRKKAERLEAKRELRGEFGLKTRTREPGTGDFRRTYRRKADAPTRERKAMKDALLNGRGGCSDDWIDVAAAQDLLNPRQAEALRRLRALTEAYRRAVAAPHMAPDILASLLSTARSGTGPDEDAVRRIKHALEDALASMNETRRTDREAVEAHVCQRAMPLSRAMDRIRAGASCLAQHFAL